LRKDESGIGTMTNDRSSRFHNIFTRFSRREEPLVALISQMKAWPLFGFDAANKRKCRNTKDKRIRAKQIA